MAGDCNDASEAINPGATEVCDGVDNDCDGTIDEGVINTDGDLLADCVDPDDDNDGTPDGADCAPLDAAKWRTGSFYVDADGDGEWWSIGGADEWRDDSTAKNATTPSNATTEANGCGEDCNVSAGYEMR